MLPWYWSEALITYTSSSTISIDPQLVIPYSITTMQVSKITTKGQVTIPQKLRKMLGVRPGDKIVFEASDDGKVLIRNIDSRVSLAGFLKPHITRAATDQEIDKAIEHGWAGRGGD